jgi:hypothetical protein
MKDEDGDEIPFGMDMRMTPMGFCAIRMHYSSDPEKNVAHPDPEIAARAQKWFDVQHATYTDPNAWAQEMEINFFAGTGARVFPQYSQTYHERTLKLRRNKTIYCALDFGWHCPAALFAQIDGEGRLCFIKEYVGAKQTTHEFATELLARTAGWFPNHAAGIEYFCDPAGQYVKTMESEKSERRDTEVLSGLGIHASYKFGWSRKDARSLVHRLLQLRTDGTPSLFLDPGGCPLTSQAFLGRYIYPTTKDGRQKPEPEDEENHPWADVMATVRYLVIGLHAKLGIMKYALGKESKPRPEVNYQGYGTPIR